MTEIQTCVQCGHDFQIFEEDHIFYKRFDVPPPRKCPNCRLQRRLMERNSRNLYYRTCNATGKKTLSQYHEDQPFPVYSPAAWWSDTFDATEYGRDFDFSRPFFEQFLTLKQKVPHLALFNTEGTMENSDFNNCTGYIKNCYLIAESDLCEDCYYSNLLKKCTNIVDCSICYDDELCYECIDCINCYNLQYSQDCQHCRDSVFLENCLGCSDCIGCINQRHKKYMIFNQQYSREDYEQKKKTFGLDTRSGVVKLRNACEEFFYTQPHKAVIADHNQHSIGDHLFDSKNAFYCFDSKDLEDCRYCAKLSLGVKDSMDYNSWGNQCELMYQCAGIGDHCYNCKFCVISQVNMMNCEYCYECFSCQDCFGCVGLKKQRYCIFNKKYTRENYEMLRGRIIAHMQNTGEWGEFFPIDVCAFAYNESIAIDVFPFTKEEALARGYRWRDDDTTKPKEAVTHDTFLCSCGKQYKMITQELRFYRQIDVPLPSICPTCRHKARMKRRRPLMLWKRSCARCGVAIETSYASGRPEIVYCEQCYLQVVY